MPNPDRIEPMLGLLRQYWHAHPDMRLGQILDVMCCMSGNHDVGYVEDYVLEQKLREHVLERRSEVRAEARPYNPAGKW